MSPAGHQAAPPPPAWARVVLPEGLRRLRQELESEIVAAERNAPPTPWTKYVLKRCATVLDALIKGGAA